MYIYTSDRQRFMMETRPNVYQLMMANCVVHTHTAPTGNRWPATSATKKIRGNTQHMHSKLNDMHDVAK